MFSPEPCASATALQNNQQIFALLQAPGKRRKRKDWACQAGKKEEQEIGKKNNVIEKVGWGQGKNEIVKGKRRERERERGGEGKGIDTLECSPPPPSPIRL